MHCLKDFFAECRNTRLFVQRQVEGYGLICPPRVIKICQVSLNFVSRTIPAALGLNYSQNLRKELELIKKFKLRTV